MAWKSLAAASVALLALPALAQQAPLSGGAAAPQGGAPPPPALSGPAWVVAGTAELALLDKVTARTRTVELPVGGHTEFGTLSLSVARCMRRPPEEPADSAAWIVVTDSHAAAGSPPVFRGWMFATSPALNPLQHPVYDVRVLACK
jgi:hypothetical protein